MRLWFIVYLIYIIIFKNQSKNHRKGGDTVANNPYSKIGRMMFLITWLLVFFLMLLVFNRWESKSSQTAAVSIDSRGRQMIIQGDRQGHYRFEGYINGVKVRFMIDTGASDVAVPNPLARQLNLTRYYPVQLNTANGQAQGHLTRLRTLTIGPIHLQNVRAVIMPGDGGKTVLLGMNVLSDLEMSQKENQLTIKQK